MHGRRRSFSVDAKSRFTGNNIPHKLQATLNYSFDQFRINFFKSRSSHKNLNKLKCHLGRGISSISSFLKSPFGKNFSNQLTKYVHGAVRKTNHLLALEN